MIVFFTSGGGIDDEVQLIEQIIKDVNSMCISFNDKHPQTFWES